MYTDIYQNLREKDYGGLFSGDYYVENYAYTRKIWKKFFKSNKTNRTEILKKMVDFLQYPTRQTFMETNRKGEMECRVLNGKRMYVEYDKKLNLIVFKEISRKSRQKDKKKMLLNH